MTTNLYYICLNYPFYIGTYYNNMGPYSEQTDGGCGNDRRKLLLNPIGKGRNREKGHFKLDFVHSKYPCNDQNSLDYTNYM